MRLACLPFFATAFAFAACGVSGKNQDSLESPRIGGERFEARLVGQEMVEPPRLVGASVSPGVNSVALDAPVFFVFDKPLARTRVRADTVRIVRADNGEIVRGETRYINNRLEFFPERKFFAVEKGDDGKPTTLYSGLQPDAGYLLSIGDIFGEDGSLSAASNQTYSFSTVRVDAGISWIGDDGEYEKFRPGNEEKYFDPARPTVLYLHGWQKGTSESNMFRENPFLYTSQAFGSGNLVRAWRSQGFNVGVFHWSQFADEPDVRDAEWKIWTAGEDAPGGANKGLQRMRYRVRSGGFVNVSDGKSVADLFVETYLQAFANYRGPGVRLVGHSLGAQLAGHATYLISKEAEAGRIPSEIVPTRLALLDAFWSKGGRAYLGGKSTAQVFLAEMQELVKSRKVVVEQVKTSALGGIFAGDENLGLRKLTAFHRVWPRFLPVTDQASQHVYSVPWYLGTIQLSLPTTRGFTGAALNDDDARKNMNLSRSNSLVHFKQISGANTPDVVDDKFEDALGVETW